MNHRIKYILAVLLLGAILALVESLFLGIELSWYWHLLNGLICVAFGWVPPLRRLLANAIKGS